MRPTVHGTLWGRDASIRSQDSSLSLGLLPVPALRSAESQQSLLSAEAVACMEVMLNSASPPVAFLKGNHPLCCFY